MVQMDQSACSRRSCDLSIINWHVARAVVANQSVGHVIGVMTWCKSDLMGCDFWGGVLLPYSPVTLTLTLRALIFVDELEFSSM